MINQQVTPNFLFTLSASDTKWPYFHALITTAHSTRLAQEYQCKVHNIISNTHITSQYMHNRFNAFLQEVLEKGFHITNSWCRYFTISSFLFFSSYFSLYTFWFLIYSFSFDAGMNGNIEDRHTFMVLFGWKMHQIWTSYTENMFL